MSQVSQLLEAEFFAEQQRVDDDIRSDERDAQDQFESDCECNHLEFERED